MTTQVTITNDGPGRVRVQDRDEDSNKTAPRTLQPGESTKVTLWGGQLAKITEEPEEPAAEPVEGAHTLAPTGIESAEAHGGEQPEETRVDAMVQRSKKSR